MSNRLKDLKLESVDLCYKGCNPEAKINLFKSAEEKGVRKLDLNDFTPEEIEQLREMLAEVEPEEQAELEEPEEGGLKHKLRMLLGKRKCEAKKQVEVPLEPETEIQKIEQEEENLLEKEALEKMVTERVDAVLEKLAGKIQTSVSNLEKAQQESELAEMLNIAKQFTEDKPEDLAKNLVALKAADENLYQAHLELLQQNKTLVKASKAFEELGKTGGYSSGSVNKIEAVAAELRKQDPSLNHWQARAKAWELNPEIKKEYEEDLI